MIISGDTSLSKIKVLIDLLTKYLKPTASTPFYEMAEATIYSHLLFEEAVALKSECEKITRATTDLRPPPPRT